MYFPAITRRLAYKTKIDGTKYASYSAYYDEIAQDCAHRCVYCDVLIAEVGGESMHLDHFRPQKYFPELGNDPCNLVLACPRCNQLKSDWWPEKEGTANGGLNGFVDPFKEPMLKYVDVDNAGNLRPLSHPSRYMIDLMALNRPTRRNIRRARAIKAKAYALFDHINGEIEALNSLSEDEMRLRVPILSDALRKIRIMLAEAD
jgi:hypothetical protein